MKKIIRNIVLGSAVVMLSACSKEIPLSPGLEQFNVTTAAKTYKLSETVRFQIEGNPDLISFFSGELYNDYEYKDGRTINIDKVDYSFSSANLVEAAPFQNNQLAVLISTDFNGNYSSIEHVNAATWTDITPQFTLSKTASYVTSGEYKISELAVPGKPLYIAFKNTIAPIRTNGKPRPWYLYQHKLNAVSEFGDHLIADYPGSNFQIVEQKPSEAKTTTTITSTRISLMPYDVSEDSAPDPGTETWAISRAFNLFDINSGPDRPLVIKGNEDAKLKTYDYTFTRPGNYKVYFIGSNVNVDNSAKKVIQLDITIEDEVAD
jgi:hypothetical protein